MAVTIATIEVTRRLPPSSPSNCRSGPAVHPRVNIPERATTKKGDDDYSTPSSYLDRGSTRSTLGAERYVWAVLVFGSLIVVRRAGADLPGQATGAVTRGILMIATIPATTMTVCWNLQEASGCAIAPSESSNIYLLPLLLCMLF
jgi:hypothetical protein